MLGDKTVDQESKKENVNSNQNQKEFIYFWYNLRCVTIPCILYQTLTLIESPSFSTSKIQVINHFTTLKRFLKMKFEVEVVSYH